MERSKCFFVKSSNMFSKETWVQLYMKRDWFLFCKISTKFLTKFYLKTILNCNVQCCISWNFNWWVENDRIIYLRFEWITSIIRIITTLIKRRQVIRNCQTTLIILINFNYFLSLPGNLWKKHSLCKWVEQSTSWDNFLKWEKS